MECGRPAAIHTTQLIWLKKPMPSRPCLRSAIMAPLPSSIPSGWVVSPLSSRAGGRSTQPGRTELCCSRPCLTQRVCSFRGSSSSPWIPLLPEVIDRGPRTLPLFLHWGGRTLSWASLTRLWWPSLTACSSSMRPRRRASSLHALHDPRGAGPDGGPRIR